MGGAFSRSKGRREEQQLVLYLAKLGFKAERILRQYQAAGQPDVKAVRAGKEYTFEMKSRKDSFKSIYDTYFADRGPGNFLGVHLPEVCIAISTVFEDLLAPTLVFLHRAVFGSSKAKDRGYKRLVTLQALKQSADFLVIKDNNRPRLFIKYWN